MNQTTDTPGSVKGASDAAVTLRVFNPVGFVEVDPVQPADRPTDLNNKRVGLYWNRKHRGDVALKAVEDLLGSQFTHMEKESPWAPYHVDKGFRSEESTVTALTVVCQMEVQDLDSNTPEGFLRTYVNTIPTIGTGSGIQQTPSDTDLRPTRYGHEPVVLLPPSAAKTFAENGWTKADIRAHLFEHARVPKRVWMEFSRYK